MSVWVVVGGQYGSEGKGKISAYITLKESIDICVRAGGPNSGHCFVADSGTLKVLRQIPTGYIRPATRLLIPAGGLVDLEVLKGELDHLELGPQRVGVDCRTMIIEGRDRQIESDLGLRQRLSSTLCGVGSALARRVLRGDDVVLAERAAERLSWLKPYLTDVASEINSGVDRNKNVLIEGTQGFGLSLYHSTSYPKTTSRDTTAAGFLSECGVSPKLVTNIVLVLRTFPIRVAGEQAGPMFKEIDWETVRRESGYPTDVSEFTTVTGKLRRVGRFDLNLARRAVAINRPTQLALNFLDYISFKNRSAGSEQDLTSDALTEIVQLEEELEVPVRYVGVGPSLTETFVRYSTAPFDLSGGLRGQRTHGSQRTA